MTEPGFDPGGSARRLVRATDKATLATTLESPATGTGGPYASLVLAACDHDANPILLSDLAEHTRNIARDGRASLFFDGTAGYENPLSHPRITLLGRIVKTNKEDIRRRYLGRHPDASAYADFADFAVYHMTVERAHLVAGFGEIHWIEGADFNYDSSAATDLIASETDILDHMNADHSDAVARYATGILGREGDVWRLTRVDPEGFDLRMGGDVARIDFDSPVDTAEAARAQFVSLARWPG